jgi:hypothetical protein
MTMQLDWEGQPNAPLMTLTDYDAEYDFTSFGGIHNNADARTGKVLFTTTGYTASGEGGTVVLQFKKLRPEGGSLLFTEAIGPTTGSLAFSGIAPTITVV